MHIPTIYELEKSWENDKNVILEMPEKSYSGDNVLFAIFLLCFLMIVVMIVGQ